VTANHLPTRRPKAHRIWLAWMLRAAARESWGFARHTGTASEPYQRRKGHNSADV
jgi:hypothetical protein